MFKRIALLFAAGALAVAATIFQQATSSYNPVKSEITINENDYSFKLPTVHEGDEECLIELYLPDSAVTGNVQYRLYNSNEEWKSNKLIRLSDNMITILPNQKPLIKLEYYLELNYKGTPFTVRKENPVVVRFQKETHKAIQYPYVLLLFTGLVFSCFAGLLAIYKSDSYRKYGITTFYFVAGSFFLALLVHFVSTRHILLQLSPYNDMSIYRMILIFFVWFWCYRANIKKEARIVTIIASILMLILFSFPQKYIFMMF
jgi:hypothetical protein